MDLCATSNRSVLVRCHIALRCQGFQSVTLQHDDPIETNCSTSLGLYRHRKTVSTLYDAVLLVSLNCDCAVFTLTFFINKNIIVCFAFWILLLSGFLWIVTFFNSKFRFEIQISTVLFSTESVD